LSARVHGYPSFRDARLDEARHSRYGAWKPTSLNISKRPRTLASARCRSIARSSALLIAAMRASTLQERDRLRAEAVWQPRTSRCRPASRAPVEEILELAQPPARSSGLATGARHQLFISVRSQRRRKCAHQRDRVAI